MNTFSLRWLFVAVAATALAVTAILNANQAWQFAVECVFVVAVGVAILYAVFHGRAGSFAIGFAAFTLLAMWVDPTIDMPSYFDVDDNRSVYYLMRVFNWTALGFVGGFVGRFFGDPVPRRLALAISLTATLLFAGAILAAATVKVKRLKAAGETSGAVDGFMGGFGMPGRP
ncbi:MAG: hypothetical protein U0836_10920 [Pirellulales bacterium]